MDFKDYIKNKDCEGNALSLDILREVFKENIYLYSDAFKAVDDLRKPMSPYEEYLYNTGFQDAIALLCLTNLAERY